jgi:hypothetical protein
MTDNVIESTENCSTTDTRLDSDEGMATSTAEAPSLSSSPQPQDHLEIDIESHHLPTTQPMSDDDGEDPNTESGDALLPDHDGTAGALHSSPEEENGPNSLEANDGTAAEHSSAEGTGSRPLEAYVVEESISVAEAQPYEDPRIHFKKYTCVAWVIACILLMAIVVSVSVLVTNKNNQIQEVESHTISPTQEQILPNSTLILEPVMAQALQEDSESALAAYDWLLKVDEGGILFDYTTPDWRVIQRYIAAYLYFTTGGEGWVLWFFQELDAPSFSFLNATSECEWNARIHFFF